MITIDTTSAPIFSATFAGLAFVFSLISLVLNFRFNRRSKQADIQVGFHNRFDGLQVERAKLLCRSASDAPSTEDHQAKIFFDRFWSLQFDQYVAWQHRYVSDDLYRFWVFARWRQLQHPTPDWNLNGLTVQSTFEEIQRKWAREPSRGAGHPSLVNGFLSMFDELKGLTKEDEVHRLIAKNSRSLWPELDAPYPA